MLVERICYADKSIRVLSLNGTVWPTYIVAKMGLELLLITLHVKSELSRREALTQAIEVLITVPKH